MIGIGLYIGQKVQGVKDAWELYKATQSSDAGLDVLTKLSELAAGVAVGYLFERTAGLFLPDPGLDRVFDSMGGKKFPDTDAPGHTDFIKNQRLIREVAALGGGLASDQLIAALRDYVERNRSLDPFFDLITGQSVSSDTDSFFTNAQRSRPRKDPLTLDLDGDGIETVAPSSANPILFDHDGDGIKIGTGWIKGDDGFLVLDRDGNQSIDDGTELFGDATPLSIGGKAADGFAALAQEDTNGDGIVSSSDENYSKLRVWQDWNQDGLSQAGELKTLAELDIVGINVAKSENSQVLANGNEIADLGTFTRSDGSEPIRVRPQSNTFRPVQRVFKYSLFAT